MNVVLYVVRADKIVVQTDKVLEVASETPSNKPFTAKITFTPDPPIFDARIKLWFEAGHPTITLTFANLDDQTAFINRMRQRKSGNPLDLLDLKDVLEEIEFVG